MRQTKLALGFAAALVIGLSVSAAEAAGPIATGAAASAKTTAAEAGAVEQVGGRRRFSRGYRAGFLFGPRFFFRRRCL
jgi:phosphate-selective porin